ncbi:MAG: binding-protein-dependent transport system inner rane component [Acidimicrobiales bacterium]|nr:binding-protein-dependent transport system inner rane component [Acidimicrobiales bacterium]
MGRFIIRRLIGVVLLLIIVSMATFGIFFLAPKLVGTNPARLFAGRVADDEAIKAVEKKLGLDKPIYVQYEKYAVGVVAGRHFDNGPDKTYCPPPCLGFSFKNDRPVWNLMLDRLPVTLSMAIGAAILWLVTGVSIGILSALRRGSVFDRAAMTIALAGVSLPVYFTGLLALSIFSYKYNVFPNVHYVPITDNPLLWARNLILPWICLAFLYSATYARLTRANMLETMGEDYIRTARAKGLPEKTVIGRHGFRAALTPIVTIFGLDLGGLLGGAVLTETVFGFPGVGKLAVDAIGQSDLPIILGVTVFAAFFIIMANLIVDVLYAYVDPRVRYH